MIGTSAAMPSRARSHVSFVLWPGESILVECGPTVPWQLQRLGVDHRLINDLFISHLHGDHSIGLAPFLTLAELDGRPWPLRVYCPTSAIPTLKLICSHASPSLARIVEEKVEWIGLDDAGGDGLTLAGGARVSWAPGIHKVADLAYRFDYGGRSIVYSGDTGPAEPIKNLAAGADLLLHEATWSETIDGRTSPDHSSARQAGRLAAEAGARQLALVHLHKDYLGLEDQLAAEAGAGYRGTLLIPNDGDLIEL
jgi:ribonuclease BN (tRNA processing enzyme)